MMCASTAGVSRPSTWVATGRGTYRTPEAGTRTPYHSPVKPQEYLKKRVDLMKTFYEERIPYYVYLENLFKISALVRNSC